MFEFLLGESARLEVEVTDLLGEFIDPAAVVLRVIDPLGLETQPTVEKTATGRYAATVQLNQPGLWYWRWQTALPDVSATEGSLTVLRSRFA